MDFTFRYDCKDIDWGVVAQTLKQVGMANFTPEVHKKAFENSRVVVFVFYEETLVGFGRALSDGAYQAAIYDVAIVPEYQGQGLGGFIVDRIKKSLPQCNFILYAAPGKEEFYAKMGFRKMRTGMALFTHPDAMSKKGITE